MALIWRSLKYIHKVSPNYITFNTASSVLNAASGYISVYMTAFILNELVGDRDPQRLLFLVILTIALEFTAGLINDGMSRISRVRTFKFWQDFGMTLNMAVASFDYTAMEDPETHKKIDYYQELLIEIGGGPGQLSGFIYRVAYSITNIVMSAAIITEIAAKGFFIGSDEWYLSWPVNAAAFTVIAVIAVYRIRTSVVTTKSSQEAVEDNLVYSRIMKYYMGDYLSNYRSGKDIRIYGEEELILKNIRSDISDAERVMIKITKNNRLSYLISQSTSRFENIIVTVLVGLRAIYGFIGVGDVTKAISGVSGIINGTSDLASAFAQMFVNNKCMEAFFAVIDTPNRMYRGTLSVEKRAFYDHGGNGYEIEFCHVSFKYPQSDNYALKDVSLKFRVGERLAVVGMNGSGKTTFIKLLCRLYDPTEGEILLNGINIKKYNYDEFMSIFSVVFQDFNLFAVTIGQNITASPDYDRDKVRCCLEKVGMGRRFAEMPDGVDTYIYKNFDDKGVEISGGEAQKIVLARALYKDAPIIVLDEPTAALDPVAEFEIYSNFNEIVGDKTAVYISHRLSSCRFCDEIVVFHEGNLIQRGSHSELVAADGKYRELWFAQAQYYTENREKDKDETFCLSP
jgi:ATP-binding cassette subfamily B protein